jgi:hypothetical protein
MHCNWLIWLVLPALTACTREMDRIQVIGESCLYAVAPEISKTRMKLGQTVTVALPTNYPLISIEILPKKVSFLILDRVVGEDTTQPYTFVWTPKTGDPSIPATGSVDLPVYARASFDNQKCDFTTRSYRFLTVVVSEPAPQP